MTRIDGNTLDGVSATTLWTLHNRGTEAKRSGGVIRDPWAVTLFDAISYDYRKFGKPNQSHALRALAFDSWFSRRTLKGFKMSDRYVAPPMPFGLTADEGLALAERIPGVRAARDIALPPGRGIFKLAAWPPLDRIGFLRRIRPSITLLEFG
jgi:hypothetical protein